MFHLLHAFYIDQSFVSEVVNSKSKSLLVTLGVPMLRLWPFIKSSHVISFSSSPSSKTATDVNRATL